MYDLYGFDLRDFNIRDADFWYMSEIGKKYFNIAGWSAIDTHKFVHEIT